jgi:polysaccharide biosynthesis protein PslH
VRILTLALGVPFPPLGGGLTRTFHLLKALSAEHDLTLVAFTYGEPHQDPPYRVQIESVPFQWSDAYRQMNGADPVAAARAYERLTFDDAHPWFASVIQPEAMESTVRRCLSSAPDLVLLEGAPLARFLPALPAHLPCVLDLFDVHSVMARRVLDLASPADRAAAAREAERTLAFEREAVQRSAACLAVSENDAAAARNLLGATDVHIVANGVDTTYFAPSSSQTERGALLFTGRMNYKPNADAVCYFAEEILPLVHRACPQARFHIVGATPPSRVSALVSDSVVVHGQVADIRPYFTAADAVVVPILEGGGTRLKLLEAAASGKAIVSTSLGVEGLAFAPGRDLLVADTPATFAAALVTVLGDDARRDALGSEARAKALQYDWTVIGEVLRDTVAAVYSRVADVRY